jgi:hypothetical protein
MDDVMNTLNTDYTNYFGNDELAKLAMKFSCLYVKPDLKYNKEETDKIVNSFVEAVPDLSE